MNDNLRKHQNIEIISRKFEIQTQMIKYLLDITTKSEKLAVDDILKLALEFGISLTQSEIAYFHFVNEDQETISLQVCSAKTIDISNLPTLKKHYPISKAGVWVDCFYERKPVFHNNYAKLLDKKEFPQSPLPLIRVLAVPVIIENKVVAIFGVGNKQDIYNEIEGEYLQIFAESIWNIVRRKNAENDLLMAKQTAEANETKFRLLIENSNDGFWVLDLNFNYLYLAPIENAIFGYTYEESLILPIEKLHKPEHFAKVKEYVNKRVNEYYINGKKEPLFIESECYHKNGDTVYIEVSAKFVFGEDGKITAIQGTTRNVTQRKLQELALIKAKKQVEETNQLYLSILQTIPYGMDIVDKTGVILYQNDNLKKNFRKSVIGNICWEVYRDNKTQCDNCPLKTHINIRESIQCVSNGALQGRTFYISHTGIKFNGIDAILEIFHDITEQKLSEKALIKAKEKAEESNRLKTAFLNNISHEIRTPLNAICGFSQLIVNSKNPIEKQKKFADEILKNSDKLVEIITDVIEISQIQSKQIALNKNDFVFGLFITEIKEKFIPIAKNKNLLFFINADIELLKIHTDYEKLKKILFHLIDNAIKFTVQGFINLKFELINNNLLFTIKDTGIGIAENMQDLIFEPFRQVETDLSRNFGGNGLGLTLIKAYVELLNGSISMQSEINKGTTFHITIPNILKIEKVVNKIENHKKFIVKTILIVEDEYANYQYLEELLSDSGFHILHATNGQEAVDLCRNNSTIDLIFMDIKMPIMDGQTATKIIREFRFDIPIIAQTAYALEIEREKFITDFDDYISKPISEQTLKEKLEKFLL